MAKGPWADVCVTSAVLAAPFNSRLQRTASARSARIAADGAQGR